MWLSMIIETKKPKIVIDNQYKMQVFTPSSTLNSLFEYVDDLLVEDMSRPLLEHQVDI